MREEQESVAALIGSYVVLSGIHGEPGIQRSKVGIYGGGYLFLTIYTIYYIKIYYIIIYYDIIDYDIICMPYAVIFRWRVQTRL